MTSSRWQFSLRTLLIAVVILALALSLGKLAGSEALAATLLLGLWLGLVISILGRNKSGKAPPVITFASITGALVAEICGVYVLRFQELNETVSPNGADRVLFWCAFGGSLFGALSAVAGLFLASKTIGRGDEPGSC